MEPEYVIGKYDVSPWNPLSIVLIGNVLLEAANCNTKITNAKNFPTSPKFLIRNCIILTKVIPTKILAV